MNNTFITVGGTISGPAWLRNIPQIRPERPFYPYYGFSLTCPNCGGVMNIELHGREAAAFALGEPVPTPCCGALLHTRR